VPPPASAADTPSTLIAEASSTPAKFAGETFLDKTFYLPIRPESLVLSGRADATSGYSVDDILDVAIGHMDKSPTNYFSFDFSNNCSGTVNPVPAGKVLDLTGSLKPGGNTIQIKFRDKCGSHSGNTNLYFAGAEVQQTAGDRDPATATPSTPGVTKNPGTVSDCGAIGPAIFNPKPGGPSVEGRKVRANAKIATSNFFCGSALGQAQLYVAKCSSCAYKKVAETKFKYLPTSGTLSTSIMTTALRKGTNHYRVDVVVRYPQFDTESGIPYLDYKTEVRQTVPVALNG
jgi:hypothetical protein